MPHLNVEVDQGLMTALRVVAASEGLTLKTLVAKRLIDSLITEHEAATQKVVECREPR